MSTISASAYANLGLEFRATDIAAAYEIGRPGYPALLATIIQNAHAANSNNPNANVTIAEPGAGTGLLTATLIAEWKKLPAQITHYYASDPSKAMVAGIPRHPVLAEALGNDLLYVSGETITENYAPKPVDIIVTGQAKHWDTRLGEIEESVERTLGLLTEGGAEFAIYNVPIDSHLGFTAELNTLINELCPDPYYQAMTSGDAGRFLGKDAKSNFAAYFNMLAERGNGEVFYATLSNLTRYKSAEKVISYVFSNAFIKKAIENDPVTEIDLIQGVQDLFDEYKVEAIGAGVYYGNTTVIFGAIGLKRPGMQWNGVRLPENAIGRNDFSLS